MHFLVHSFTHSFVHLFTHSFVHSFTHSFVHSFTHSFIHSFTHSFIHLFIQYTIHYFIYSFYFSTFTTIFVFQISQPEIDLSRWMLTDSSQEQWSESEMVAYVMAAFLAYQILSRSKVYLQSMNLLISKNKK